MLCNLYLSSFVLTKDLLSDTFCTIFFTNYVVVITAYSNSNHFEHQRVAFPTDTLEECMGSCGILYHTQFPPILASVWDTRNSSVWDNNHKAKGLRGEAAAAAAAAANKTGGHPGKVEKRA